MNPRLLEILVCPQTHQLVRLAAPEQVRDLNRRIEEGSLRNQAGQVVVEPLDGGLLREDNKVLYPIRRDIPIMLIEEAIPLPGL